MFCKNCGAEIDDGLLLCPYCKTENEAVALKEHKEEILDMDVSIEITYPDENGELDVDASIEIDTDELSDLSSERIDEVIDESYLELDEYINEHYR